MKQLRADIWCAAFVRRHNDIGHMCVVARKGDPVAGQVWVEVDHLNGTHSLYVPAPNIMTENDTDSRLFQCRYAGVDALKIRERIAQEIAFDPDLWVIALELRNGDPGLEVAESAD